jgi:hypothetical protein
MLTLRKMNHYPDDRTMPIIANLCDCEAEFTGYLDFTDIILDINNPCVNLQHFKVPKLHVRKDKSTKIMFDYGCGGKTVAQIWCDALQELIDGNPNSLHVDNTTKVARHDLVDGLMVITIKQNYVSTIINQICKVVK